MKTLTRHLVSVGKVAGSVAAILFAIAAPGSTQSRAGAAAIHSAGHVGGARPIPHATGHIGMPVNPNFAPVGRVPGTSTGRRSGDRDRARRSFITPIFGLPYYYAFDTGYPYDNSVPNNYITPSEQPPAEPLTPAAPDASEPAYVEPRAPEAPVQAPVPPPELGQLILVRRDGQVVMAVAFTTSSGRLTYITKDGLRRSFPVAELDPDATRQMNSVNGTSVALPN